MRTAELAETVRAAQHEGEPDPPSDTDDSSLARAELAWRTALEQSVEAESGRADRAEAEVARLSAAVAESEASIAELVERVRALETTHSSHDQTTARLSAALMAAESRGTSQRIEADGQLAAAQQENARLAEELAALKSAAETARLAPAPAPAPAGPNEIVRFPPKRRASALLAVLAGFGALVAAGVVVAMALDGRLLTPVGIAASAVTVVLALVAALSRTRSGKIWIDRGTVHIEGPAGNHQFDLTSENTRLQMVGEPGRRGWRVEFLRRAMGPFVIDGRMVDAHAFVDGVRRWRPDL